MMKLSGRNVKSKAIAIKHARHKAVQVYTATLTSSALILILLLLGSGRLIGP